jgi:hypothetical protein
MGRADLAGRRGGSLNLPIVAALRPSGEMRVERGAAGAPLVCLAAGVGHVNLFDRP